ncbi:uracil-DNA glycosylase-like protein [Lyophyllum atratum]|nr:uracil-DNA glycosylase-like protein [Lyophyllum atratum]
MNQSHDEQHDPNGISTEVSTSTVLSGFRASLASFAFVPDAGNASGQTTPRRSESKGESMKRSPKSPNLNLEILASQTALDVKEEPSITRTPGPSSRKRKRSETRASASPRKKQVEPRGYASPETYAHLRELQDHLAEGLDGAPGQKSAEIGHHFGHPTNHFWSCLHQSGFTPAKLKPEEDHTLPKRFSLGLTNLVDRPTAEQNELSADEQTAGVPTLLAKVALYRPRILCFIGLDIAKTAQKQLSLPKKFQGVKVATSTTGLQSYKLVYSDSHSRAIGPRETLFYALPSSSARVVIPQKPEKIQLFAVLKQLLEQVKQGELDTDGLYAITRP